MSAPEFVACGRSGLRVGISRRNPRVLRAALVVSVCIAAFAELRVFLTTGTDVVGLLGAGSLAEAHVATPVAFVEAGEIV